MDGPRRSLRKREEKSYVESPDFIIDDLLKGQGNASPATNGPHSPAGGGGGANHNSHHHPLKDGIMSNSIISNGDVEMESEEEDDGAPLPHLPEPKVGPFLSKPHSFLQSVQ